MADQRIVNAGVNPRIAGTRITVYTIYEFLLAGSARMTSRSGSNLREIRLTRRPATSRRIEKRWRRNTQR